MTLRFRPAPVAPRVALFAALSLLFLPSCAWFVSRKEADGMELRVTRVSEAFAARSTDEAALQDNLARVKQELEKIREERENYLQRQAQFMEEVRDRFEDLQTRVEAFEKRLAAVSGRMDTELARQLQDVLAALAARAAELAELEKLAREVAWISTQLKPEELADVVAALAAAKQWRLAHGHLALLIQRHPGAAPTGAAIAGLVETASATAELSRVVLYAELYRRQFPAGPAVARVTFRLAQAHAAFMDCAKAIPTLQGYLTAHPKGEDLQAASELLEHLEKMRHSRQVCAP